MDSSQGLVGDSSTRRPLLEVKDLSVRFESSSGLAPAIPVRKMSFSIQQGEALALVGESGSGKSLTALALMDLLPSEAVRTGSVYWFGKSISEFPRSEWVGRRVAMIFQDPVSSLNPSFTIGAQLDECLRHFADHARRKWSKEDRIRRAVELLTEVGIENALERLSAYPHEMSGGMNQRVGIALALSCEPELLIADEPTTALDVTVQKQILDLLVKLKRSRRMSLLLITHDLAVAASVCDRFAVMYSGELVEMGSRAAVVSRAMHPYTEALLRARPSSRLNSLSKEKRLFAIAGSVPSAQDHSLGCRFRKRCLYRKSDCGDEVSVALRSAVPSGALIATDGTSEAATGPETGERLVRCLFPLNQEQTR